jgi:hypothetical protein
MNGSDEDEDHLLMWNQHTQVMLAAAAVMTSDGETVNAEGQWQSVNPGIGVRDVLCSMSVTPVIFKRLTNFSLDEFNDLCAQVCPTLDVTARSTGELIRGAGRRPKLSSRQRVLNAILYLKHCNTIYHESFTWNWAKSSVCDDIIFVCTAINRVMVDEIKWPNAARRAELGQRLPEFPGCIGLIDGTLCQISRPHDDPDHSRWFNGRKKMYAMNNTVVVDHDGLFIYVDPGYPGSFHDVTILRHSELYENWRTFFTHSNDVTEYLLGDPGYSGADMFIMRRIGVHEVSPNTAGTALHAFNLMHSGRRIKVEWGIGGLKCKFRRFIKTFDSTKPRFSHMFRTAAILTNFLHRRRMNMHYKDNGQFEGDQDAGDVYGWDETGFGDE